MAAARRATNGVKPTCDKLWRRLLLGYLRVERPEGVPCQTPRQLICL